MSARKKRTALVTGANRGIGLAIVRAGLGHAVLLGARDIKAGEEAAQSLRRFGHDVEPVQIDLNDTATIEAAVKVIAKSGHEVDALVNNAYPCATPTWESLARRGRLFHCSELPNRGRRIHVWLTAIPMSAARDCLAAPLSEKLRSASSIQ